MKMLNELLHAVERASIILDRRYRITNAKDVAMTPVQEQLSPFDMHPIFQN